MQLGWLNFGVLESIQWSLRKDKPKSITLAQKTAPMFAYYVKTHVLLNADII